MNGLPLGFRLVSQKLDYPIVTSNATAQTFSTETGQAHLHSIAQLYRLVVQPALSDIWLTCTKSLQQNLRNLWLFTLAMPSHSYHATSFLMPILLVLRLYYITERMMIRGIIWKKKPNLDHLMIPFQCVPQVASWKEERYTAGQDWKHGWAWWFEWEEGRQAVLVTCQCIG